ncbi:MAG: LPXTG cell wall anchor domain-containing protein [Micromonosporaceae bacterium]
MTRNRLSPRRLAAVTAAAFVGAAATLALASPASAHHPIVKGEAVCDTATGDWVVTWTVGNSERDLEAKVTKVELAPAGTTITNIAEGAVLPKKGAGVLTGVQRVSADKDMASLTVHAKWDRKKPVTAKAQGKVYFKDECAKETPKEAKPAAEFKTSCDMTVTVILTNAEDATAPAAFTVTGKDGFSEQKTVAPGEQAEVAVPAANAAEITVTEGAQDAVVATNERAAPANCDSLPVTGVQAGAIAAGALGLLGVGAALFFVARRRRIRFVA